MSWLISLPSPAILDEFKEYKSSSLVTILAWSYFPLTISRPHSFGRNNVERCPVGGLGEPTHPFEVLWSARQISNHPLQLASHKATIWASFLQAFCGGMFRRLYLLPSSLLASSLSISGQILRGPLASVMFFPFQQMSVMHASQGRSKGAGLSIISVLMHVRVDRGLLFRSPACHSELCRHLRTGKPLRAQSALTLSGGCRSLLHQLARQRNFTMAGRAPSRWSPAHIWYTPGKKRGGELPATSRSSVQYGAQQWGRGEEAPFETFPGPLTAHSWQTQQAPSGGHLSKPI